MDLPTTVLSAGFLTARNACFHHEQFSRGTLLRRLTAAGLALLLAFLCAAPLARAEETETAELKLADGQGAFANLTIGGETLRMAVDTGATLTVIDRRFRDRFGSMVRHVPAGTDCADSPEAEICVSHGGKLGDFELDLSRVACIDLGAPAQEAGVDGLLGMNFLKGHALDFDWDAQTLRITKRAPEVPGRRTVINLVYSGGQTPYIEADAGKVRDLWMGIDTGYNGWISLSPGDESKVFAGGPEKSVEAGAIVVGGIQHGRMMRLPAIDVYGLQTSDMLCDVGFPCRQYSMLGCGWLCRYRAIFDFPNNKLVLIERADSPAIEVDMSGLRITRTDGHAVVLAVGEETPASRAGIRVGEPLTTIDGTPSDKLPMATIRQRLKSGDGKTVRLDLKDGDSQRTVEIKLQRRI